MRRYSVSEIDALRQACEMKWLFGSILPPQGEGSCSMQSRSYLQADKDRGVEEMVRTYMMGGVTAKDLYEAEQKWRDELSGKGQQDA